MSPESGFRSVWSWDKCVDELVERGGQGGGAPHDGGRYPRVLRVQETEDRVQRSSDTWQKDYDYI